MFFPLLQDHLKKDREDTVLTTLHTLASGSSGNAFLFSHDGTHVLVDAGISCRRIRCSLRALDLDLADLCGIFITHTHTDHICGLQTLLKNCSAPVWASRSAAAVLEGRFWGLAGRLNPMEMGQPEAVGSFTVTPVATSHDAPAPAAFVWTPPAAARRC